MRFVDANGQSVENTFDTNRTGYFALSPAGAAFHAGPLPARDVRRPGFDRRPIRPNCAGQQEVGLATSASFNCKSDVTLSDGARRPRPADSRRQHLTELGPIGVPNIGIPTDENGVAIVGDYWTQVRVVRLSSSYQDTLDSRRHRRARL